MEGLEAVDHGRILLAILGLSSKVLRFDDYTVVRSHS